jgi:hypothetical protein
MALVMVLASHLPYAGGLLAVGADPDPQPQHVADPCGPSSAAIAVDARLSCLPKGIVQHLLIFA